MLMRGYHLSWWHEMILTGSRRDYIDHSSSIDVVALDKVAILPESAVLIPELEIGIQLDYWLICCAAWGEQGKTKVPRREKFDELFPEVE